MGEAPDIRGRVLELVETRPLGDVFGDLGCDSRRHGPRIVDPGSSA